MEPNREDGVFILQDISYIGIEENVTYQIDGERIWLTLAEPIAPETTLALRLSFTLNVPNQPEPFGFTGRQLNLGDWYPYIPPYEEASGWLAYPQSNVGEHLVYDTADFTLTLTTIGEQRDVKIATSGRVTNSEGDTITFALSHARNFSLSLSPEFRVAQKEVLGIQVASSYFPEDERAGLVALDTAVAAVETYHNLFGPFPYDSLAVVSGNLTDGQEYSGLVFMDRDLYTTYNGQAASYLVAITAHEVAHQWWYGAVGNNQAAEPWLDEALATYSELLFYEAVSPETVDWWWRVRVGRFDSDAAVGSDIYSRFDFQSYVSAVYLRGAKFLHELRAQIGDEAFFAILKLYRTEHDGEIAQAADFFTLVEQYTEQSMTPLRQTYFSKD